VKLLPPQAVTENEAATGWHSNIPLFAAMPGRLAVDELKDRTEVIYSAPGTEAP